MCFSLQCSLSFMLPLMHAHIITHNLSNVFHIVFCKNSSTVQGPSKYKRRMKRPPQSIDGTQFVRQREKTEWKTKALAEMAGCSWQGQMEGGIYGHTGPNGNSLLIDHFQLKADLQVNVERLHQVLGFQHKWKKCVHPSIWWKWPCVIRSLGKRTHVFMRKTVASLQCMDLS